MLSDRERERIEHLVQLLGELDKVDPWPPKHEQVADLCRRAFEAVEKLSADLGTSLSVCFMPSFEAESAPEALCCRSVKAISDLHAMAGMASALPSERGPALELVHELSEALERLVGRAVAKG